MPLAFEFRENAGDESRRTTRARSIRCVVRTFFLRVPNERFCQAKQRLRRASSASPSLSSSYRFAYFALLLHNNCSPAVRVLVESRVEIRRLDGKRNLNSRFFAGAKIRGTIPSGELRSRSIVGMRNGFSGFDGGREGEWRTILRVCFLLERGFGASILFSCKFSIYTFANGNARFARVYQGWEGVWSLCEVNAATGSIRTRQVPRAIGSAYKREVSLIKFARDEMTHACTPPVLPTAFNF